MAERYDLLDLVCVFWGAACTGGLLVWVWLHGDDAGLSALLTDGLLVGYPLLAWAPWSVKRAIQHWRQHWREEGDRWRQRAEKAGVGQLEDASG